MSADKKKAAPAAKPLFHKMNYILIIASILVVVIGFALMSGKEGDIYDGRRTVLAPIVVILGFVLGIVAIFYRKNEAENTEA
ncbi:MAG: DUF3098 domain-containing protein [Bacteroidetes bacterium]|nr:DUF3098 domain-containing protein [Bacteroidota bacterium]